MNYDEKLDIIITKIDSMESEMVGMKLAITGLDSKVETYHHELKSEIAEVRETLGNEIAEVRDKLGNEIAKINLKLDNEVCPNIAMVAEGHLDLSRGLKEAQKPFSEFEMLSIRVNALEGRVARLEQSN